MGEYGHNKRGAAPLLTSSGTWWQFIGLSTERCRIHRYLCGCGCEMSEWVNMEIISAIYTYSSLFGFRSFIYNFELRVNDENANGVIIIHVNTMPRCHFNLYKLGSINFSSHSTSAFNAQKLSTQMKNVRAKVMKRMREHRTKIQMQQKCSFESGIRMNGRTTENGIERKRRWIRKCMR